ncbi:hypothetical protein, partial [Actinophytocola sp.]|uniref:hypothetical protein n=1 Tax=Actinophytocola sp. TaxID=1872138 RepID=UPI00389AE868
MRSVHTRLVAMIGRPGSVRRHGGPPPSGGLTRREWRRGGGSVAGTGAVDDVTRRWDFRPDVEGLRAVAVLAVVLYHARVPGVPGGFVGVDV